jgi:hypothetical protein
LIKVCFGISEQPKFTSFKALNVSGKEKNKFLTVKLELSNLEISIIGKQVNVEDQDGQDFAHGRQKYLF